MIFIYPSVLLSQTSRDISLGSDAIRQLEFQLNGLLESADFQRYGTHVADEAIFVTAQGKILTKAEFLNNLRTAGLSISIRTSDIKVRVYEDIAILTAQVDMQLQRGNNQTLQRSRVTRVFHRAGSTWVLIHSQSSPTAR
jgi:ketosteroid isomerase-like protein